MINGWIDETEFEYTNNKHSLGLSDCKKMRCLNFWKIARSVSNFILKEPILRGNKGIDKY